MYMCVQRDLVYKGKPYWLANFKTMLLSLKYNSINILWNEWIANDLDSRFNTRTMRIKRLRFDVVHMQTGSVGHPREEMVGLDRL